MRTKTHQRLGPQGFVEDQRAFFDSLITEDWDTYHMVAWDRVRYLEVNEILRRIPSPRRLLDVGCGCGFHDVAFARVPGVKVVGIDYSAKSIEQANRYWPHPRVERRVADIREAEELLRRFGAFDLVVSFQVIEHVSDPLGFLRNCARLVHPGGHVALVTPNRLRLENRLLRFLGHSPVLMDPMHFKEYSRQEIISMAKEAGLDSRGVFGHTLRLGVGRWALIYTKSRIGQHLGRLFPSWANAMGFVFRKGDDRA